jgi:hypothetical protein
MSTLDSEDELLAKAKELRTVRRMKQWLAAREGAQEQDEEDDERRSKHIDAGADELLMFEASRVLVELLDGRRPSDEHLLEVLLAEGETTLHGMEKRWVALPGFEERQRWDDYRERMAKWRPTSRDRRAAAAESKIPEVTPLEVFEPLEALPERSKGWRRLGYASARQYATERVGMSSSSLEAKVHLARCCGDFAELAEALTSGQLGTRRAGSWLGWRRSTRSGLGPSGPRGGR